MKTIVYYLDNDRQRVVVASFYWWYQAENFVLSHYQDYNTDLFIE